MKLFGLTGGIGMGKSTAARMLRERGLAVVDTDVLARQVVEPGQPALEEVRRTFGNDLVDATGHLRRDELARRVFADPAALKQLEEILHPRIRELWQKQVEAWKTEGQTKGVVVIPLLFETGAREHFDAVICLACTRTTQQARLEARGWSREQIGQRIQAQWPVEKKMELADFVVWTEGVVEVHQEQLKRIVG